MINKLETQKPIKLEIIKDKIRMLINLTNNNSIIFHKLLNKYLIINFLK